MELEIVMLNPIRQAKKNKGHMTSHSWETEKVDIRQVGSRMVATTG
jgi:hypothetical protein